MVQKLIQPMYRYFKQVIDVGSANYIYFGEFQGLSDEILQLQIQLNINSIQN